jgi:YVTN family beta-propeller protein
MSPPFRWALPVAGAVVLAAGWFAAADKPAVKAPAAQPKYKSPTCVAFGPKGGLAYVTNHTADSVSMLDTATGKVLAEIPVGKAPTGVAVSPDAAFVYVANTRSHTVSVVGVAARKVVATIPCGFEPTGVALSRDGKRLYTANHISDDVSVIDTAARKQTERIPVGRAPTYLALTPDDKILIVNNSLSHEPATDPKLTAHISVIDTASGKVIAQRRSPGTMLLGMGAAVSPDGEFAFCVHLRPNFNITPSQLNQGWIQTNALSIISLKGDPKVYTVLLDNVSSGAANPHGVAVSRDGRKLYVSHRGIHKVSIVDLPMMKYMIKNAPPAKQATLHTNLGFLWQTDKIVQRMPTGGLGPNSLAVHPTDGSVWVANYYSNNVGVLDGRTGRLLRTIDLGGPKGMTTVRRGEFLFHDAVHCFQQWVSCTSCHPGTRADGVNWDLLNDGMTNPKNAKSLVGSWATPPAMSLGVRANMGVAVEKGFLFIQFVVPTPEELHAVRSYLRWIPHIRSPFHRKADGTLDDSASRGKKLFDDAGCASCHPAPLYTDLEMYDVGTFSKRDGAKPAPFDTPSLLELYRTAPYLHDGRAATLEDVLTKHNRNDEHGLTADFTPQQIKDLVAFLKSL